MVEQLPHCDLLRLSPFDWMICLVSETSRPLWGLGSLLFFFQSFRANAPRILCFSGGCSSFLFGSARANAPQNFDEGENGCGTGCSGSILGSFSVATFSFSASVDFKKKLSQCPRNLKCDNCTVPGISLHHFPGLCSLMHFSRTCIFFLIWCERPPQL